MVIKVVYGDLERYLNLYNSWEVFHLTESSNTMWIIIFRKPIG